MATATSTSATSASSAVVGDYSGYTWSGGLADGPHTLNASFASVTDAAYDSGDETYVLRLCDFGLAVPTGATVSGVTVTIRGKYATATSSLTYISLSSGTTAIGSSKNPGTTMPSTSNSDMTATGSAADREAQRHRRERRGIRGEDALQQLDHDHAEGLQGLREPHLQRA